MSQKTEYVQEDFFKTFSGIDRITNLEMKQDALRKGIFKRYSEQEEKIKSLHNELQILIGIIEGAVK
jgi:hypothetical protein